MAVGGAAALGGTALAGMASSAEAKTKILVYKTPTCGCCAKWVDHLDANGFAVTTKDLPSVDAIKKRYGVPAELASCHTGLVEGYAVEGHVPADVVHKLLRERPAGAAGLAVPGMPMGSPGMEGMRKDRYDVLLFDSAGRSRVYASR
jgi:hypothetical protein